MEIVQLTNEQFENFSKNYNIKNFNQTVEYGTLMDRHNFDDYYLGLIDDNNNILAATLILVNKVFIGYKWGYCPRGYLIDYNDFNLLSIFTEKLKLYLKRRNFMFVKIDPDIIYRSRNNKGEITNEINNTKILENLVSLGYEHSGFNLNFENIKPRTCAVTTLNKDEHGYNLFPEGCRHILVENNLYIIGGTNHVRQPINIVLVYHILFGTLKRLPDMIFSHSYHTVDYLENFDSIICIGGENSNQCEIMNLENKKWFKLPNLNNQRANANIYYNNLNSEIFVLFGICGIMCDKIYYSDSIEVLELKDIAKGWIIIDYYKTQGLNLKVNYCMTIPFTKEQLLIYGGSNMRSFTKNIYALFHMTKNECNKVDAQTMELIKLEEKKSRLVDLALTKLG